jgi:hypothetical protein
VKDLEKEMGIFFEHKHNAGREMERARLRAEHATLKKTAATVRLQRKQQKHKRTGLAGRNGGPATPGKNSGKCAGTSSNSAAAVDCNTATAVVGAGGGDEKQTTQDVEVADEAAGVGSGGRAGAEVGAAVVQGAMRVTIVDGRVYHTPCKSVALAYRYRIDGGGDDGGDAIGAWLREACEPNSLLFDNSSFGDGYSSCDDDSSEEDGDGGNDGDVECERADFGRGEEEEEEEGGDMHKSRQQHPTSTKGECHQPRPLHLLTWAS